MAAKDLPPNAAPRSDVEQLQRRVANLGMTWVAAVEEAGLGRATAYRFRNGTASVASARQLDEWLLRQEQKKRIPSPGTKSAQDAAIAKWTELGEKLMILEPDRFREILDGLAEYVGGVEMQQRALSKRFRATPDPDR